MRFKIALQNIGKQRMLPMDNQYFVSAWIYKVIANADKDFAFFLHSQGYNDGNKKFKFFNYSPLALGKFRIWNEKSLLEIYTGEVTLQISFHLQDAAEKFIIGLFNQQNFYLGDKFNGIDFTVSRIERLPTIVKQCYDMTQGHSIPKSSTKNYAAKSPVVISYKTDIDKYARYLSPEEQGYGDLVKQHLMQKYKAIPGAEPLPENIEIEFLLENKPKSKLITVKPYTRQQSKVRGYLYRFSLFAPEEIHRLILGAGFGEKNAQGFGWVEPGAAGPAV